MPRKNHSNQKVQRRKNGAAEAVHEWEPPPRRVQVGSTRKPVFVRPATPEELQGLVAAFRK